MEKLGSKILLLEVVDEGPLMTGQKTHSTLPVRNPLFWGRKGLKK